MDTLKTFVESKEGFKYINTVAEIKAEQYNLNYEDVLSETLFELAKVISSEDREVKYLKGYVSKSVVNSCLKLRLHKKKYPSEPDNFIEFDSVENYSLLSRFDDRDLIKLVDKTIRARFVRPVQIAIYERCYLWDIPDLEVSEQLGISYGSLRKTKFEIRKYIKSFFNY